METILMQVGETREINGYRINRCSYEVEVLATENAGKRGKVVPYWHVRSSKNGNAEFQALCEAARIACTVASEGGDGATMTAALQLVPDAIVSERTLRGIDVRPSSWATIHAATDKVAIEVAWDSFRIHDLCDHNNGTMAIPSLAKKATNVAKARAWASKQADLRATLSGLSFWQVLDLLRNNGIAVHSFCSVD